MSVSTGRPVTLQDVADAAGVSLATASRAINGSARRVKEPLRQQVLEAAERLGYQPNLQAQAVARGRASMIGLLLHDIADPYFAEIAAGVSQEAERHGLLVTLASTQRSYEREIAHLAGLRAQRAQGVILAGSRLDDAGLNARLASEIELFRRSGGRVTLVSQDVLEADTVRLENREGGLALARALVDLGYRRFAFLAAPQELLTSTERLEGFREGLETAGAGALVASAVAEFTRDGGFEAMTEILAGGEHVDCVVAANDVMAVGAMSAMRARGVRPAEDLAVAGFDDIATLRDLSPALTTVRFPLVEVGRRAMAMLLDKVETARVHRVPGEVVVRESTPPKD